MFVSFSFVASPIRWASRYSQPLSTVSHVFQGSERSLGRYSGARKETSRNNNSTKRITNSASTNQTTPPIEPAAERNYSPLHPNSSLAQPSPPHRPHPSSVHPSPPSPAGSQLKRLAQDPNTHTRTLRYMKEANSRRGPRISDCGQPEARARWTKTGFSRRFLEFSSGLLTDISRPPRAGFQSRLCYPGRLLMLEDKDINEGVCVPQAGPPSSLF